MKLLVVGAGGFVGRHLLARALGERRAALGTARPGSAADLVPFDLARDRLRDVLPAAVRTSPLRAVICAAEPRIDRCLAEPEATRRVNVEGTLQLARDLAAAGGSCVFLSTDYVFDGRRGGYRESDPPDPVNEYGRQKREVEEALLAEVPRSLVLRLSKIVGDNPAERQPFADWLSEVRRGEPLRCIAGQVFSPTAVGDVAVGILAALDRGLEGLFHLSGPEIFSREDLARLFLERLRLEAPVHCLPAEAFGFRDRRPLRTWLDGSRLASAAGLVFTPMAAVLDTMRCRLEGGNPAPADGGCPGGR